VAVQLLKQLLLQLPRMHPASWHGGRSRQRPLLRLKVPPVAVLTVTVTVTATTTRVCLSFRPRGNAAAAEGLLNALAAAGTSTKLL
jgi:hypothetical protein